MIAPMMTIPDLGLDLGLDGPRVTEILGQTTSLVALRRFLGAAVQRHALPSSAGWAQLGGVMDRERANLVPLDVELVDRLLALLPEPLPEPAAAPRPLPPEAVLAHGLGLAQGLRALEEAQGSAQLLGALLTKVLAAVQLGEPVGAQEALGQAKGLLRTLDVQLGQATVAVSLKIETQRRENDA